MKEIALCSLLDEIKALKAFSLMSGFGGRIVPAAEAEQKTENLHNGTKTSQHVTGWIQQSCMAVRLMIIQNCCLIIGDTLQIREPSLQS